MCANDAFTDAFTVTLDSVVTEMCCGGGVQVEYPALRTVILFSYILPTPSILKHIHVDVQCTVLPHTSRLAA